MRRCSEARQPFSVRSSSRSGAFGTTSMSLASTACRGAPAVIALPVRSPTWRRRFARRAAAAREPVAAVLVARELDAELLEPRDRVRRLGGEDVDELRVRGLVGAAEDVRGMLLGRVVGPTAAWMPPCAFAELHAWIEPFVARPTRAPARWAATAAARPEAPLPITSTSKRSSSATSLRIPISRAKSNPAHSDSLSCYSTERSSCSISSGLAGFGFARLPPRPAAAAASAGRSSSGTPSSRQAGRAGERGQLLDARGRIVRRADRLAEAAHGVGGDTPR